MDVPRDRGATLQGHTHVSHVDTLAGFVARITSNLGSARQVMLARAYLPRNT
jgi:hypothetical protein